MRNEDRSFLFVGGFEGFFEEFLAFAFHFVEQGFLVRVEELGDALVGLAGEFRHFVHHAHAGAAKFGDGVFDDGLDVRHLVVAQVESYFRRSHIAAVISREPAGSWPCGHRNNNHPRRRQRRRR